MKYEEAHARSDFDSLVVQPLQRLPWLTKLQLEEASQMVWQGTSEATFLTAFSSLRRKAVHCTWWQELLKPHFPLLLVWLGGKAPGKELFPPGPLTIFPFTVACLALNISLTKLNSTVTILTLSWQGHHHQHHHDHQMMIMIVGPALSGLDPYYHRNHHDHHDHHHSGSCIKWA